MAGHTAETRGLEIALSSYLVLFALQLTTYFMTGILVLFAQALKMLPFYTIVHHNGNSITLG